MEIVIHRAEPLGSEARQLPAQTYNLAHTLLARSNGVLFVPIRSMQFLAIIDAEEIVFVDHLQKDLAVIAWQHFHPQRRDALDQPVPYEAVYYRPDGAELMRQLQPAFADALRALADKEHLQQPASILKFAKPGTGT